MEGLKEAVEAGRDNGWDVGFEVSLPLLALHMICTSIPESSQYTIIDLFAMYKLVYGRSMVVDSQ